MNLWWLQPGWTDAECYRCGRNIWDSGGDPDWGQCFDCFCGSRQPEPEYPEPEYPDPPDEEAPAP